MPRGPWAEGASSSRNDSSLASPGHVISSFSVIAICTAHLPRVTCKRPSSRCLVDLDAVLGPKAASATLPLSDLGKSPSLPAWLCPHRTPLKVVLGQHFWEQSPHSPRKAVRQWIFLEVDSLLKHTN